MTRHARPISLTEDQVALVNKLFPSHLAPEVQSLIERVLTATPYASVEEDLRSRLGCVAEATNWDRPYDERLAAIRGMCDLTTNGLTPQPDPWPDCPKHKEVQHRDGMSPWCNACGWNRGRPAVPPMQIAAARGVED